MKNQVKSIFVSTILCAVLLTTLTMFPLTSSSSSPYGPELEHVRLIVIKSPTAQVLAMTTNDPATGRPYIDILTDLIRPTDVEALGAADKRILYEAADHFCYIAFNMRIKPFGPQDGSDPGRALRHAIAHLVPKGVLIGTIFKYIVTLVHAPVPPATGLWYWGRIVDPHTYDPKMAADILLEAGFSWDGSKWLMPDDTELVSGRTGGDIEFYSPTYEAAPTSHDIVKITVEHMTALKLKGPDGIWDTADDVDAPLPVYHSPIEFLSLLQLIDIRDFDMYFLCWGGLGRFPDFLYPFFHSSQDVPYGYNNPGLLNTAIDDLTFLIYSSLDHPVKMAAAHEVQELLMGTKAYQFKNTTDGILAYIPIYSRTYYEGYDEDLEGIVIERLAGGWSYWTIQNMHWATNPRTSDLVESGEMAIYCLGEEMDEPINPRFATGAYTWNVIDHIYDGLIGVNPYNSVDIPWYLDETKDPEYTTPPYNETYPEDATPGWTVELWTVPEDGSPRAGEQGMNVTYYLRDTPPMLWHDGHEFDAFDLLFYWDYATANMLTVPWADFMYYHHGEVLDMPNNRTVSAYLTTTSQFIPYGLAWCPTPEHIWGCTHERDGRAKPANVYVTTVNAWNNIDFAAIWANKGSAGPKPAGSKDAAAESGLCGDAIGTQDPWPGMKLSCEHDCGCVLDNPATPANEITQYDPTMYGRWDSHCAPYDADAQTAYPWLTELIGTGCWIFYDYDRPNMVAELVAFDTRTHGESAGKLGTLRDASPIPKLHYWRSTAEIAQLKEDLFYKAGDANYKVVKWPDYYGVNNVWDLSKEGVSYLLEHGDSGFDADADINKDWVVDISDISTTGMWYGKHKEEPPLQAPP